MVKSSSSTKMGPRTDPEAIERRRMQNRLAQRKRRLKRAQMAKEEKERQQRLQAAQAASQLTFINDGYHLQMSQPPIYPNEHPKVVPSTMNNYFDYTPPHFEDVYNSSPYYPQTPMQPFESDPSFFVNGYPSPSLSYAPSTPPLSLYTPSLIDEDLSTSGSSSSQNNIDIDPHLFLGSSAGVVSSAGAGAGKGHPFDAFGLMPLQQIQSPRLQPDRHRSTSLPTPFTPPRSVPNLSSPPSSSDVGRNRAPSTPSMLHKKNSFKKINASTSNSNMNIIKNRLSSFNPSITTSPNPAIPASATMNMNLNCNSPSTHANGKTGLHVCAEQGNSHVVQLLLGYGADIDAVDEYGRTPLHYAVQNNHIEVVRQLVEGGAMTTIADVNGRNPMHLAAASGSQEMVQMMQMMIMMTPPMMMPGQEGVNLHTGLISSA